MMSTEDIKDLLYRKLKEVYYGIPVYKDRHPPIKRARFRKGLLSTWGRCPIRLGAWDTLISIS
jgi:hypothetical protein